MKRLSKLSIILSATFFGSFFMAQAATVFYSNQVGASPSNGLYLKTDGTNSTWSAVAGGSDPFTHPAVGQSATTSLMLFNGNATSSQLSTGTTWFTGITGVAGNCLHVDTNGKVSGMGADCGTAGGEANTGGSLGTGLNLYDSKSGVQLLFNTLAAGTNITLSTTTNSNTIVINATGGGSGTVSTSTNETAGYLSYWTSNSATPALLGKVATTTASCSGSTSCTSFTILGSSPITISSTGGGLFPFSADTNFGQQVYSTSTPTLWFKSGLFASSTSQFDNATTSLFTSYGNSYLATNGGVVGIGTTSPWGLLSVNPNNIAGPAFAIGSSTATKFIVTNGGYVGIGTNAPNSPLHINYNNSAQYIGDQTNSNVYTQYNARGIFGYNGTSGKAVVQGGSGKGIEFNVNSATPGSGTVAVITSGGSLGIGTTSPWGLLSVNPDALGSGVPEFVIGSSTATRIVVTGAGNVGIGTTTPSSKVDVNGGIYSELQTLATSTTMTVDFCTSNNSLVMGVGTANIAFTWTNANLCPGKGVLLSNYTPASGVIGTTTFSGGSGSGTVIWAGGINPGSSVVNGTTDDFCFVSTASTTRYIAASLCGQH